MTTTRTSMRDLRRVCFGTSLRGAALLCSVALVCLVANGCANKQSASATAAQQGGSLATTQPTAAATPPRNEKAKNYELNRWLSETIVDVPPAIYRVAPPDKIKITATGIKELDQQSATIRSDGKVAINLIGDLYVAGLSPSEISEEISRRLSKFYNSSSVYVSVEVTAFESKKYYVFGQVFSPGVKVYTGRDTIVKVLAEAQLNEDAWPQKVVLIRPSENTDVRQKVTIDLKQMYMAGKADQNYLLEEGDLIYVPPSPLAEFRLRFERLMAPIRPVADFAMMGFGGF
jgi:polysaccharide export outer membrane protein